MRLPNDPGRKQESALIGVGMVIAAGIAAQRGNEDVASEILVAADVTSISDLREIGADAYDARLLRRVLRALKRRFEVLRAPS